MAECKSCNYVQACFQHYRRSRNAEQREHKIKNLLGCHQKMAISVSKKRSNKSSRRREANGLLTFSLSFLARVFLRFPAAIFLLILILLYASSTTIISGNIVHVCVTSRKLNNLYCLSAGSQPSYEVPIVQQSTSELQILRVNESSSSIASSTNKGNNIKEAVKLLESPISVVNNSFIEPQDALPSPQTGADPTRQRSVSSSISNPRDEETVNVQKDSALPVPLLNDGSISTNSEKIETPKEIVDVKTEDTIQTVNNSTIQPKNEELEIAYKDVEEQLRIHRSWISNHHNPLSCDGRGIYVYELPSKFNKDLAGHCGDMIPWGSLCRYFSNEALGEPIKKLGNGWYQTHQYLLEPIFHSRVLNHPCRVYNENEAKLFYVPYYGGLDILRWHFKNVSNTVKDSLALELIRWLETQEPWYRKGGKDHIFVLGKISWDFRRDSRSSWGTRFLELAELQNPIKLLIERQPWQVNDIGVPHPTSFHPHTDDDIVSWQLKIIKYNRKNLVSFAGGARPDALDNVRNVLIDQCSSTPGEQCKFLNCSSGGCDQTETITELFMESEFCLQPPGDSPTRKSVFDSLISGCIPVMFDPFTAFYQYPWHLPEDHDKYSVFINKDEVKRNGVNVIERLMKIPTRERENMRRYIVYELMPGLVYAESGSKLEKFQDAFTIAMNNLLQIGNKFDDL